MLEDSLTNGALVVLVLEARLLVVVHVRLRSAEVLATSTTDGAREVHGVEVGIVVVRAHMDLVVALELERLKQKDCI